MRDWLPKMGRQLPALFHSFFSIVIEFFLSGFLREKMHACFYRERQSFTRRKIRKDLNSQICIPGLEVNIMAYKHEGWTLYTRNVKLKGGRNQTIYFFSKRSPKSGTPCELPTGYAVGVNKRTGLPYLKKK
jgi:hypothetical protein